MNKKRYFIRLQSIYQFAGFASVLSVAVFLSGCTKMQNLNELLTLKSIADEQAQLDARVERDDKRFYQLVEAHKQGQLKELSAQEIHSRYGDPIYKRVVSEADQTQEVWVYRRAVQFFDTDRIILTFDAQGQLLQSEWIEIPKPESPPEAPEQDLQP